MDELIKINRKVKLKQIGRFVGAIAGNTAFYIFVYQMAKQDGITECQRAIHNEFPDLYEKMTDRVLKLFNE
jgi:hypothetical protein